MYSSNAISFQVNRLVVKRTYGTYQISGLKITCLPQSDQGWAVHFYAQQHVVEGCLTDCGRGEKYIQFNQLN